MPNPVPRGLPEPEDLRALRIAAATFGGIVSIASEAIISTSADQHVIHFNRGAEQIFGYRAEEIVGQHLDVLIPPRFRATHRGHVEAFGHGPVEARRMGERREISGVRKNGEEFPAEASISKLDVDGERIYTVVLRDSTVQKRAEMAQRFLASAGAVLAGSLEVDATLRNIVTVAVPILADWCIVFEAGGSSVRRIDMAHTDPGMQPLFDELLQAPVPGVVSDVVLRVVETGAPELIRAVDPAEFAAVGRTPRQLELLGMFTPTSAIVVPLLARGTARGAIGLFRGADAQPYDADDFTLAQDLAARAALALENARLYAAARDALSARDEILSIVSHDLGNPLSAIRIGTSLLLRRLSVEERESGGWAHLEAIRESTEQMERLIGDLLEVRRLDSGKLSLDARRLAVAPVLHTAADQIAPLAHARSVSIQVDVADDLPQVSADRQRLLQVLSNLLGNAVKFTPEGGAITVTAAGSENGITVTVCDTGPGIPEADLPRVFERFWQANKGSGGIGLGLAITRAIVEAHGGEITVTNRPDGGACFQFRLPAAV